MDRLEIALWETDRHAAALGEALADWDAAPPEGLLQVESNPALRRLTDQLLFRFLKLQDALGERLVPATLAALLEPDADRPMLDKLNRLDRLGYVRLDDWLQWRDLRNRLSHEYPEQTEVRWATLKAAVRASKDLLSTYARWRDLLARKL
jgi:hypothetical protein